MFAICIESSHQRGMGHFFRALNIRTYLESVGERSIFLINRDEISVTILREKNIPFVLVDYEDTSSNWEAALIRQYQIDVWLLDRFQTGRQMAEHVKQQNILLVAIDDCGDGAELVDLHFCGMLFSNLHGKHIFSGKDYLVLNPEIARYRRKRDRLDKILVTLGGSDTYGVTVKVVQILKKRGYAASIVIGPNFKHDKELSNELNAQFQVYRSVPSLVKLFYDYDLAITGGGVTCFETSASGLPSIIIANEPHEVPVARYVESFGGAVFAGYYQQMDESVFDLSRLPLPAMSQAAMTFSLSGVENIYHEIKKYRVIQAAKE